MIPYGRQHISDDDIEAVVAVLRSDFLTQGPTVPQFEAAFAAGCGARHAVATCNATAALHLACLALGLGPGDRLWTSPNTFVASANCARYCGAEVDFVDIDPHTYNLSVPVLAAKLADARRDGRLPKIVVPVHFAGQPCDMTGIRALADEYGFAIIEDASHAVGARYRGKPVGGCDCSDITVFSFHPVKIITTGEGGMATTNDPRLAERMALLRSHGITRDPAQMEGAPDGAWSYEQIALGFNYRMTDLQAALGLSQLRRLDDYVARRAQLAQRYDAALRPLPVTCPRQAPDSASSWHLYVLRVGEAPGSPARATLFAALRALGIGVNVHYIPVHTQPDYRRLGFRRGDFPEAERYYAHAISLPLFPTMSDADQEMVIAAVRAAIAGAASPSALC
ncbi:UDP-4-amino-4,6-dideoxy-N-acetyl-beta-L-altrosamine transaminase [Rhodocyclus tenuis]|uniref:UDP-4-amino-4, 6-dideoxy-N-acetyl-beta-L-altrosamine transaminase n=1 Tax=Rhodocyclus tenuis TaxID=1066 RepID=UPI0019077F63|nr:UDP-4-amino-4,6-dideoxy-N-acetyl-beta-L-altrosamine transaminase [Rhodocyclus tenuis]MBK1679952.1 UDP-4-amino-4,6-dideoxy-N-acetyl-beta-L-altrosamine transaminase [Rhodocyclus tenuis]